MNIQIKQGKGRKCFREDIFNIINDIFARKCITWFIFSFTVKSIANSIVFSKCISSFQITEFQIELSMLLSEKKDTNCFNRPVN